jgi:hypothetical protein
MGETKNVYKISVGKPEGKRTLGRSMRRWEDNIRLDAPGSRQGLVAGFCEHGNEPSGSMKVRNLTRQMTLASQKGLCSMQSVNLKEGEHL